MKHNISLSAILLFVVSAYSQTKSFPTRYLGLNFAQSKHGSGDIRGFAFSTEYAKMFRKKISWTATFGGTLHDGSRKLFYTSPNGTNIDGSIRYTTAGIQTSFGLNYSILQTQNDDLYFGLNSLIRYQSTSYYDVVTILYPPITGLPVPVVYFENTSPARTLALGGAAQLGYKYVITNQVVLGIFGNFQVDTNGDVLTQVGLSVGKRF